MTSIDNRARRILQRCRTLVQDRVRITNRITPALKAHFAQVLSWFRGKEAAVFADFVERWPPTLELVQRTRTETLTVFFRAHHVRYRTAIDRRLAAIRQELPLTSDPAASQPTRPLVEVLLPQLRYQCPPSSARPSSNGSGRPSRAPSWANAFYASCKARGMQHQAALRALAFKWMRILYRCWADRVPCDESVSDLSPR